MELYNGRPEDISGRKEKEIKVYDILDRLHIPFIRVDHEAVMTMEAYLNVTPGSATVMGLIFDPENKVQLLVDEDLLELEEFGCHPCVNTSSIKMKTKDVFDKFLKEIHHNYITVKLSDGNEQE